MPFNGSGTYAAPSLPGSFNPAVTGQPASPTDWNVLLADISTALSTTITSDGQSAITANIPFATHRITGLGDPVDAQDAATKYYVLANPRGYIDGLRLSRSSATVIGIAAGFCLNSTNVTGITLAAFTKSTAGTWVTGSGNNGMGTGLTIANNTWYHVFAIINGGTADVYFDTSVTAANAPASTTAFRRIGSFKTNGSAQIIDFTQTGDLFRWVAATLDINNVTLVASGTFVLNVPTGLPVIWFGRFAAQATTGSYGAYNADILTPGTTGNVNAVAVMGWATSAGTSQASTMGEILTNTAATVNFTAAVGGSISALGGYVTTHGWIDRRGRDD